MPEYDLARLYRETRERLSGLVLRLNDHELASPVPACPGWSVSDVMYHLLAGVEDVMAGRLTGPPNDDQTARQVARHRGTPVHSVVETWGELAPSFEELIGRAAVWPAVIDLASHEQDIRGALGRPGARDSDAVRVGAERLVALMRPAVPMHVVCEDFEARVGPEDSKDPGLMLRTTRFDAFRWRMGRRSRPQVLDYDWSDDPTPVIDQLFVFGPSPTDIVE
ncbi:MAG: maleylpyruvate isomerase N-terminal domain-containing protein [Acidimicrobiaceae bacterium]|nr:maleylpyruvate isomerase N-terminal domain-containing protein [Acidimicrobiaceae bacterium]